MQLLESRAQVQLNNKCAEVRKLCSVFNYESELQKLIDTVKTIKTFLLDADSKCLELTNEGQNWVENLKDAVYDADDLMDEFNTIANMPGANKISKKVRRFFSSKNPMIFAFNTSLEVKKLREKLDSLAKNHSDFGFSDLYKPDVKIRKETCSYVYEQSIIGRDVDRKAIVDLLLKDDSETNVSFVTIVGIGGLGKTALAQLVFSDNRIKEAFEDSMYWVCVSVNFDTKDIIGEIIKNNGLSFEDLHKKFREQTEGKRYLLVLDDVWSENNRKWDELKDFLILGGTGSRILVTSRSKKVARAIGNYPIHELEGLSEEDSWELFKKISLGDREDEVVTGLVEIGKDIVRKCANVPLCIRVVASLLREQDLTAWQSYRRMDFAKMRGDEDDLMQTLMFSYYHLDPAVKSCFSFCSVFPQDYRIQKEKLISLWSAHGYLVPSGTDNNIEDLGERYFSILLHRCFFQDLLYECRRFTTFKMHDLMHDLARKIAGKESLTLSASSTPGVEGKVRHLYIDHSKEYLANLSCSSNSSSKTLRSFLINDEILISDVDAIFSKCSHLRVLDLTNQLNSKTLLPDTLSSLLHLRYLDLSYNKDLVMLPKSITKLYNLQTLILFGCKNLKELPKDTSKLVNLRVLDIDRCDSLNHMPAGMGTLTCLESLTNFIVCRDDEVKQDNKGKLIDLKALISKLRGELHVEHYANYNDVPYHNRVTVYLETSKLCCKLKSYHEEGQETLLEALFFKHQLPTWVSGLVCIYMSNCHELQYLPSSLSQLCHLRKLLIYGLDNVEYIESDAPSPSAKFFPSLEVLTLCEMPKLKGWWRDIRWTDKEAFFTPSFPHLRKLAIQECKRLAYFPPCQHEALKLCMNGGGVQSKPLYIKRLVIDSAFIFNFLGMEYVGIARDIELVKIENLEQIREVFQSCASSLQDLKIGNCRGIQYLGLEHLTNLKSLKLEGNTDGIPWESLYSLPSLKVKDFDAGMLPKGIQYLTSLQSLYLCSCKALEELGECIASLTSLQFLQIQFCNKLKSLPEEMCYLTSLNTLEIEYCRELKSLPKALRHLTNLTKLIILHPNPELRDRCRKSDGEYWPNICHIPKLRIQY